MPYKFDDDVDECDGNCINCRFFDCVSEEKTAIKDEFDYEAYLERKAERKLNSKYETYGDF